MEIVGMIVAVSYFLFNVILCLVLKDQSRKIDEIKKALFEDRILLIKKE